MAMLNDVLAVQRCYPQIYLACHGSHVRRKSTPFALTPNDSSLLSHLDKAEASTARDLADHLGVADSTLSASLTRLQRLGYVERKASRKDRRISLLRLTNKGEAALAATSVLDTERVKALLSILETSARKDALRGLELLAQAGRELQKGEASDRRKRRR